MAIREFYTSDGTDQARILRGRSGNPEGGPYVLLVITILGDRISEVNWESNGCPAAQLSACALAAFIKGRPINNALQLDAKDLITLVGGLPEGKGYYAQLAIDALRLAVQEDQL